MERYHLKEQLGDGTYGSVVKAISKETGKVVAIKRMKRKFPSWSECVSLREIESLRALSSHPNVVDLHEVIRESDSGLYFVFEYMPDGNLYELMRRCADRRGPSGSGGRGEDRRGTGGPQHALTHSRIQSVLSQVLAGLAHMHTRGYFHRDIKKPENLLLSGPVCKVADFGLARSVRSLPPYTDYVSTRWYRAPEVLLRSPRYGTPVDSFAVGCVMAELFSLRPLFPGKSELDQLEKIAGVLGPPDEGNWPEGVRLASRMKLAFPEVVEEGTASRKTPQKTPKKGRKGCSSRVVVRRSLERAVPMAPPEALGLMRDLLQWDPKRRPSSGGALQYAYFADEGQNPPGRHGQGISPVQGGARRPNSAARVMDQRHDPHGRSPRSDARPQHLPPPDADGPSGPGAKRKSPDEAEAPRGPPRARPPSDEAQNAQPGRPPHGPRHGRDAPPGPGPADFGGAQFGEPSSGRSAVADCPPAPSAARPGFGAPQFLGAPSPTPAAAVRRHRGGGPFGAPQFRGGVGDGATPGLEAEAAPGGAAVAPASASASRPARNSAHHRAGGLGNFDGFNADVIANGRHPAQGRGDFHLTSPTKYHRRDERGGLGDESGVGGSFGADRSWTGTGGVRRPPIASSGTGDRSAFGFTPGDASMSSQLGAPSSGRRSGGGGGLSGAGLRAMQQGGPLGGRRGRTPRTLGSPMALYVGGGGGSGGGGVIGNTGVSGGSGAGAPNPYKFPAATAMTLSPARGLSSGFGRFKFR